MAATTRAPTDTPAVHWPAPPAGAEDAAGDDALADAGDAPEPCPPLDAEMFAAEGRNDEMPLPSVGSWEALRQRWYTVLSTLPNLESLFSSMHLRQSVYSVHLSFCGR